MKNCPYCKKGNRDDAIVCSYCSRDIQEKTHDASNNSNLKDELMTDFPEKEKQKSTAIKYSDLKFTKPNPPFVPKPAQLPEKPKVTEMDYLIDNNRLLTLISTQLHSIGSILQFFFIISLIMLILNGCTVLFGS